MTRTRDDSVPAEQARAMARGERAVGRRIGAVVSSLLIPGAGHIWLGRWQRGLLFPAALVAAVLSIPLTEMVGVAALVAVYLAMIVDAVRVVPSPRPRVLKFLAGSVGLLVALVSVRALLVAYYIEAFAIPSSGMAPTLVAGDHIFAEKLGRSPGRGDIIVHRDPDDPDVYFAKRVVALGGDELAIRDGTLILDGEPRELQGREDCEFWDRDPQRDRWEQRRQSCGFERLAGERYAVTHSGQSPLGDFPPGTDEPFVVPDGTVFVLGDNRENSRDSRSFGPVGADDVVGTVRFLWWSSGPEGVRWSRIGTSLR